MDTDLKAREDRIRRVCAKHDCRLKKTPSRHWTREWYGPGYMIIDSSNTVVEGCGFRQYDADIERAEWYALEVLEKSRTRFQGPPSSMT